MTRLRLYLICLIAGVLGAAVASCRTNNGDIGHLYGEWEMTGLIYDDGTEGMTPGNYLRFQNDIVAVTVTGDHHDYLVTFGRWSRDGDMLTLDFSGSPDIDLATLGWLGLSGQMTIRCEILTETRRSLILQAWPPGREPVTYLFEKVI